MISSTRANITTEDEWYKAHNCNHAHCPYNCEHPQPALLTDGRLICMRCRVIDNILTEMIPCTPDVCND